MYRELPSAVELPVVVARMGQLPARSGGSVTGVEYSEPNWSDGLGQLQTQALYVDDAAITVSSNVRFQGPLFSGGSSVTLGDTYDGDFDKGIVYAPNATIHLSGGAVTGAVVGKKVFAAGNPKVTYAHVDLTEVPWSFDPAGDPGDRLQWHVCWDECLSDPDTNRPGNNPGTT